MLRRPLTRFRGRNNHVNPFRRLLPRVYMTLTMILFLRRFRDILQAAGFVDIELVDPQTEAHLSFPLGEMSGEEVTSTGRVKKPAKSAAARSLA